MQLYWELFYIMYMDYVKLHAWQQCLISTHDKVIHGCNPQEMKIGPTVTSNHWKRIQLTSSARYHALGLSPRQTCWSRTEHTTEHKCTQDKRWSARAFFPRKIERIGWPDNEQKL